MKKILLTILASLFLVMPAVSHAAPVQGSIYFASTSPVVPNFLPIGTLGQCLGIAASTTVAGSPLFPAWSGSCGGSGSGTVNTGVIGQIGYYSGTTAISGISTSTIQYGLNKGKILDLPFDETTGSTTFDVSPNRLTATLCSGFDSGFAQCTTGPSPTHANGVFGNGLLFSGQLGVTALVLDPNSLFGNLSEMTVNAWINATSTQPSGTIGVIVSKHESGFTGSFLFELNGATTLEGYVNTTTGGGNLARAISTATIPNAFDGRWHMASMVYSSSTATYQLYWDSKPVTTTCLAQGTSLCPPTGPTNTSNITVTVGNFQEMGAGFGGSIDELGIWNRALSATEIGQLYSKGGYNTYATSTSVVASTTDEYISNVGGNPAGTFLAADKSGHVIATTTPSGGGGSGTVGAGTIGQFPFYPGSGTTVNATSTINVNTASEIMINTNVPGYALRIKSPYDGDSILNGYDSAYPSGLIDIQDNGTSTQALGFAGLGDCGGDKNSTCVSADDSSQQVTIQGNTVSMPGATFKPTLQTINGPLGVGTTTPAWPLQEAGTRPFFVQSDMTSGLNAKHWFTASEGGNYYIGTSSDSLLATSTYLTIFNGGDISVGTTSDSQNALFTVAPSGTKKGLVVRPLAGYSTNSVEWYDSQNSLRLNFNQNGALTIGGALTISAGASISSNSGAGVPLTVNGLAAQTVDIQRWFRSSGGAQFGEITNIGNFGIGTTTTPFLTDFATTSQAGFFPQLALTDNGASTNFKHWTVSNRGGNLYFATSSDAFATSTIPALTLSSLSYVGIATTSPFSNLSVQGTVAMNGLTVFASGDSALCLRPGGQVTSDSGVSSCIVSSKYVKNFIADDTLPGAEARIAKLQPVLFTYKDSGEADIGLFAEDVAKIDPRYAQYTQVPRDDDGHHFNVGDPAAINWSAITADMIVVLQAKDMPQKTDSTIYIFLGVISLSIIIMFGLIIKKK